MYTKSLVGAAAIVVVGCALGFGSPSATTVTFPSAKVAARGGTIEARITNANSLIACELTTVSMRDGSRTRTRSIPNGAGNVTIDLVLARGDYNASVLCSSELSAAPLVLVDDQPVSLPG